ncbi:F-box/LRR-repeat protein 12-like [Haliotis rubra]|uniref:F-box/LRR-repeat protein 12-like n=1 Tax=Haliotis rubra TaxID=36100 RepID=UPI001EE5EE10|nr:F-box/LRR-repeat protein 12-like [Haliotis rubra]
MNSLLYNIILEILCVIFPSNIAVFLDGRVCRRWRRIVQDNSLWRHVDLLPYVLSLNKMWKVMRAHFSECLLTMKLGGFCDPKSTKWKKHSLSDAMLLDLQERCPKMLSLTLVKCNTDNLNCKNLPRSLKHLTMNQCAWTPRWLKTSIDLDLTNLDLTKCSRVDNFDLADIAEKFPNLKHLVLNHCYRVTESGLEKIVTMLTDLTHLELSDTACSDLTIHHMCRNLPHLKNLNLSRCGQMNQSSLGTIAGALKELQSLNVAYCRQISLEGLTQLTAAPALCNLVLEGCKLTEADIKSLNESLGEKVHLVQHTVDSC